MKVLCVGSNYAHHVRELGGLPPAEPVWFWKPESAIIHDGQSIVLPPESHDVHHEVELAVRIGQRARHLEGPAAGRRAVDAFTVAIDVTARDLQARAKAEGRPWAMAKGFDTFLPLGAWQPAADVDLQDLALRITVNGKVKQEGKTADMTWDVGSLVHLASKWTTLEVGDILLTGTPEGVGPLQPGQKITAEILSHARLEVDVRGH